MVPNVTFLILNAVFGHKFKTQPRLIVSLIMVIISFTFTAIMVWVDTDSWQQEFMTLTLVSVAFINTNAAIFQGGILGVAGKFPPQYMGAVFGGQAVGGIFASGCNVVFLALGASAVMSGFFCFVTSVVFLLTSLVAYLFVTRSEFYQHYLGEKSQSEDQEKKPEDSKLLESKGDSPVSVPVTVNPLRVLLQISPYAAAVLICFLVTLGCFPAITVQVEHHLIQQFLSSEGASIDIFRILLSLFFNLSCTYLRLFLQWTRKLRGLEPSSFQLDVSFSSTSETISEDSSLR